MKLFIQTFLLIFISTAFSQEIIYDNPPSLLTDNAKIDCKDIVAEKDFCKLKLIVKNTSKTNYLVFDFSKVGFEYTGKGTYYPEKGKNLVLEPGVDKSKTVKIADGFNYLIGSFQLSMEGLFLAVNEQAASISNMDIALESTSSSSNKNVELTYEKGSAKKGSVSLAFEIKNDNPDNLILVNPNKFVVTDSGGNILPSTNKEEKVATLLYEDVYKLKLNFDSEETAFIVNSEAGISIFDLKSVTTPKINITSPQAAKEIPETTEPITITEQAAQQCPAVKGPQDGSVQVKMFTEANICFKLNIDGFPIIQDFTQNTIFFLNPGQHRLKFILSDGTSVEEKILIPTTLQAVGYNLKEKGNGSYNLKFRVGDQVLSAEGQQNMNDMMARTKASAEIKDGSSSSGVSSSGCYGEASSGVTSVKLNITWKGNPVAGHDIQVKSNGAVLGTNTTDSGGSVRIKTSSLKSKNIDVYGCNGSTKWSVTGDWVYLDDSNSYDLKLDEIAKVMGEMMGMSVDQIGAGWGF